jgi:hypothetical protein
VEYADDYQLIGFVINRIDHDIGQTSHDPFLGAGRLARMSDIGEAS